VAGACEGGFDKSPTLCSLLSRLSSELEGQDSNQETAFRNSSVLGARIQCLSRHKGLYKAAMATMADRATRNLANHTASNGETRSELSLGQDGLTSILATDTLLWGLGRVLTSYQQTVQSLLLLRALPGVPMETLEKFKRLHITSAFTCRVGPCARATVGFEDDASRLEHERGHLRHLYCEESNCPYPPFNTARALKDHVNSHHKDVTVTPRAIRHNQPPIKRSTIGTPSSKRPSAIRSGQPPSPGPAARAGDSIVAEGGPKILEVEPITPLEQFRYTTWVTQGNRLFGTNASVHALKIHLEYVYDRNKDCFDIENDKPRAEAEPLTDWGIPEAFCICRRAEAGMMIECDLCQEWYHDKCLKIVRGNVNQDGKYACPVCDWKVGVPRDYARPTFEDLGRWREDLPKLSFQPEEHQILDKIIRDALAFRTHITVYCNSALSTASKPETQRFYLRKLMGAGILLAYETNFFRHQLHKQRSPFAPMPPPL
jgi:hypothetical protein